MFDQTVDMCKWYKQVTHSYDYNNNILTQRFNIW